MKTKLICALVCLAMLFALCACGKGGGSREDHLGLNDAVVSHTTVDNYGATPTPTLQPVPTAVPTPVQTIPVITPVPVVTPVPTIPVITGVTTSPAIVNVDTSTPKVTKSPTSETLDEGGRCVFIARADYAQSIKWEIVSPDLNTVYDAASAVYYFNGLVIEGANNEKLVLNNVPYSMNGWRARCTFTGSSGKQAYSEMASVFVNKVDPNEQKAKQLSETCRGTVNTYGSPYGFVTGSVKDYQYSKESGYAEYSVSLTRGGVELRTLFRSYPSTGKSAPVSMMWLESEASKNVYWFDPNDANVWSYFVQDVNDIAAYYGVGTAGSAPIVPVTTPTPVPYYTPMPEFITPTPAATVPTAVPESSWPTSDGQVIIIG